MNRIVLMAVPQPVDLDGTGRLNVAVFVQPLLDGPTVAASPLAQWSPAALAGADVRVEIATDAAGVPLPVRATAAFASVPGLWPRIFPGDMRAMPQDGAADERALKVRAVAQGVDRVAAAYATLAARPVPPEGQVVADAALAVDLAPDEPGDDEDVDPALVDAPAPSPSAPEFHRTVALLREHPLLLRSLGLVFDLRCEPIDLRSLPAEGVMRVSIPAGTFPGLETATPWTAFRRSGGTVHIAADADVVEGMLALDPARWSLSTLDTDVALSVLRDGARGGGLPALRTGGIALLDRGKRQLAEARRGRRRVAALRDAAREVLTLDDLLLGYRIDVRRGDGPFQPLCARLVRYRVDEDPVGAPDTFEEGNVKAHAAFDYGDGMLRADEQFARWQGWSLAVGNPLATVAPAGPPRPGLSWSFTVPPRSLPKLRFGAKYHLRARAADITGGGLTVAAAIGDRHAIGPVFYRRYEPVTSPQVVAADLPPSSPGETDSDVVVRSDRGISPDDFALAHPDYPRQPRRTLLPSLVSLAMVEQHGMFDTLPAETVAAIIADHSSAAATPGDALFPDPAAAGVAMRGAAGATPVALATRGWAAWPDGDGKTIALRAVAEGVAATAEWEAGAEGDELVVSLAPGCTMTLLLSSTMQEDFPDHFAANVDLPDQESRDAAMNGMHPLLTPATTITLTHAVRRPLRDPAGALATDRVAGTTVAVLRPEPPDLSLDPPSTAAVLVSASWVEVDDTRATVREDIAVGRTPIAADTGRWLQPVVQEFGDTRHRRVTYRITGESRHRHFFVAGDDERRFRVETTLAPVDVPSSARPPRPDVVEVIPARRMRDADPVSGVILDRRYDGVLRVILRSPWHLSGEGEQLAILVATGTGPQPDSQDLVTRISRDALFDTAMPAQWPQGEHFPLRTIATALPPSDLAAHITAVPHGVWHDGHAWLCDVAIDGLDDAYMPAVRLSVARYQRHSLPDLSHSPATLLAPVPLFPARRLRVSLRGRQAVVTLSGTALAAGDHRVIVRVEGCAAATADTAEWSTDAPDPSSGFFHRVTPEMMDASGAVNEDVVVDLPDTAERLRLVVTEVETLPVTDGTQVPWGRLPQGRIVFAEIVMLPG